MCGIVGFVGRGPAAAPILDALRRLEYRGYDSAGIATLERGILLRSFTTASSKIIANCVVSSSWPVRTSLRIRTLR
jgi:glucosamine--fructose-6-phosphate aminotransferase (isomerizing)